MWHTPGQQVEHVRCSTAVTGTVLSCMNAALKIATGSGMQPTAATCVCAAQVAREEWRVSMATVSGIEDPVARRKQMLLLQQVRKARKGKKHGRKHFLMLAS